jgi:cell division protein FtsB
MLPITFDQGIAFGHKRRRARSGLRPRNVARKRSAEARALNRWLVGLTVGCVLIGLAYVWVRLQVAVVGYRLSATRDAIEALEQEGQELNAEAAALIAPERLEAAARTRLGMVRSQVGQEAVLP